MKMYFPWRHAVCVPRMNPGPPSSATSLYSESRLYLNCDDEHRLVGTAALDAVADVEHDQAVVPPRRVHHAVLNVDVVQHHAGGRLLRPPLATLLGMRRVGDVDDVQRARAVVREVDVRAELRLLVNERRVHAGGDAVREFGDLLRVQRDRANRR